MEHVVRLTFVIRQKIYNVILQLYVIVQQDIIGLDRRVVNFLFYKNLLRRVAQIKKILKDPLRCGQSTCTSNAQCYGSVDPLGFVHNQDCSGGWPPWRSCWGLLGCFTIPGPPDRCQGLLAHG